MTLHEYLMSEQAREDVRALIVPACGTLRKTREIGLLRFRWSCDDFKAWMRVGLRLRSSGLLETLRVYYRPDGDRFVVTDLGEGVRALRLRTGARYIDILQKCRRTQRAEHFYGAFGQIYDATIGAGNWERGSGIGALFDASTEADHTNLPDAICRVMLASLRVAEVAP